MRLNQITVLVADIERSTAFYLTLGLKRIVAAPHYARFLCPDGNSTFSIERSETPAAPGGVTIYFECQDFDTTVAALKAQGVAFETDPTDQRWLWREARLSDPDGNKLCLYFAGENRIRPPWVLT